MNQQSILDAVQQQYSAVARSGLSNVSPEVQSIAQAFGYAPEDLASLPPQANMGLSCGNPVALAGLREGEVVLDLGCGGGLDVLLAAQRVGPTGKAIGIDMTPDMIERAKAGAAQVGAGNVEFHLARIDQLPLPDNSVDCVISNCVINLVPDKSAVFGEILRVLKPAGRMVVSDIALKQPLPDEVARDVQAYVGCIAGAILISDYERKLREAGLVDVVVQDTGADLNAYAQAGSGGCCSTTSGGCGAPASADVQPLHDGLTQVLQQFDANAYAASVRVHALKSEVNRSVSLPPRDSAMSQIQVYDKPMCCSTGVCGPEVDPTLARFAADLDWLKSQGHPVRRHNLAQEPQAFLRNSDVQRVLTQEGVESLPIVAVDGRVVSMGAYPSREQLADWAGHDPAADLLPVMSGGCCSGSGCC